MNMFDDESSESSGYLPKKLPGGFNLLKRGASRGDKMNQAQTNTKILAAAVLTFSSSFLVALAHMEAPSLMLYAYLFTLVNFAGYVFIYNRTRTGDKVLPVRVVSAISAMLAGGFTASTAMAFGSRLAIMNPRNIVAYAVLMILMTLVLLPEQAIDMIE